MKTTRRLARQFDTRVDIPTFIPAPAAVVPDRMETWAKDVLLALRKNRRAWQNPTNGSQ